MNIDDELERLLTQYRPVAPPPELRGRIVSLASNRSAEGFALLIEWLPAAAALLLAVLFYSFAVSARRDVAAAAAAIEAERKRQWTELTRTLGDGILARRLLDAEEQMVRRDVEQNPASMIRD